MDNYYGTLEAPVNQKLDEGYDVILEIEVAGRDAGAQKAPGRGDGVHRAAVL